MTPTPCRRALTLRATASRALALPLATGIHAGPHATATTRPRHGALFGWCGRQGHAALLRALQHLFMMLRPHRRTLLVAARRAHGVTVFDTLLLGHQLTTENRLSGRFNRQSTGRGQ